MTARVLRDAWPDDFLPANYVNIHHLRGFYAKLLPPKVFYGLVSVQFLVELLVFLFTPDSQNRSKLWIYGMPTKGIRQSRTIIPANSEFKRIE